MESTSIEYIVERNCDVAQVGGLLDNKGYGIAMKKSKKIIIHVFIYVIRQFDILYFILDSPYRQPMSESILQLQEEGKLMRFKDKWWKEKRGGGVCTVSNT